MSGGVVFKRCGCRASGSSRLLGEQCDRLTYRVHGRWYFHCSVTTFAGARERVRRGGYASRSAAEHARDELLAQSKQECTTATWTVERWLRDRLSTRDQYQLSTLRSYADHVDRILIPHLGRVRLGELTGRQVTAMFAQLAATVGRHGRTPAPSTLHRIRATLRSGMNGAIREGLIRDNPARYVEPPTPRRPQAQVWTDNRVREWEGSGLRHAVVVWTQTQVAAFLAFVAVDRLYAMWWLVALRGLRRGEAAGLRWVDVDLDGKVVMIT